ncbi:unnamed protein product [Dicrocoelium dendriticum]|nr:unnamed protein product [Dicrocoelium dendriticum]
MSSCDQLDAVNSPTDITNTYGLDLDTIYNITLKFFAEKADKAFHVTFDDRMHLSALGLQAKYGKCDRSKTLPPGFFDFVGKRRIAQWESLGDMNRDEAKLEFIGLISKLCPFFQSHLEAYSRNTMGSSLSPPTAPEAQIHCEDPHELTSSAPLSAMNSDPIAFITQNEAAIRAALNEQTHEQFMQYASQHYPSDLSKQAELIAHLQKRHFHEYVAYVEQQCRQQFKQSPQHPHTASDIPSAALCNRRPPGSAAPEVGDISADSVLPMATPNTPLPGDNLQQITSRTVTPSKFVAADSSKEKLPSDVCSNPSPDASNDQLAASESPSSSLNGQMTSVCPADSLIRPATMWTRAEMHEFKEHLADSKDAVFQVGCGEVITIRVPVYPSGTSIVWEFATDDYDIGFGLFFEWSCEDSDESTHLLQMKGEHDTSNRTDDLSTVTSSPQIEEIIPIYRRNCHKEIYCGSHVYPALGTYLLKFDNSYSLWRQKTLYCRVFYTCS